jgi:hypothetical protein
MSTVWKWILGVLAVLVVLGLIAGAVFVMWNHAPANFAARVTRRQQYGPAAPGTPAAPSAPGTPAAPNNQPRARAPYGFRPNDGFRSFGRMPMMGESRGFGRFGGWMPFGFGLFFLGGFFHWIIPLAILVVVAILFYELGKRAGRASAFQAPPSGPPPAEPPRPGRRVARR